MALWTEFRDFSLKSSFMDMAVGIIIGAGVGKVVASLVNDVIMPPIGMMLGKMDFKDLAFVLKEKVLGPDGAVVDPGVYVRYGMFLNNLFEFMITAFCVFMMIKTMARARVAMEKMSEHVKEGVAHIHIKKQGDPR